MSKQVLSKAQRLQRAKADVEKTLRRTGYYRSREKYGLPDGVSMPDLSVVSNCSPTSDRFFPTSPKRFLPADAKQFAVGTSHKQGPMLITKFDNLADMGGKKV